MNIDIRNAVIGNMKSMDAAGIRETITDAISTREEKTLPGLGVMFELMWNQLDETLKNQIVSKISNSLK